jgi:hypothetical protein
MVLYAENNSQRKTVVASVAQDKNMIKTWKPEKLNL